MKRREFLTLSTMGAMSLLVSGCGLGAITGQNETPADSNNATGGNNMKIVVITSSPHPKDRSTSVYLADRFSDGARRAGHEVFVFDAANANINPCRACGSCGMNGPCVWGDDIENVLMPKMLEADLLVLTTPLYYWTVSTQLKTVIDRFYARSSALHKKKSILMATAGSNHSWTFEPLDSYYKTMVNYMEWEDMGVVLAANCFDRPKVEQSDFGAQAENLGAGLQ